HARIYQAAGAPRLQSIIAGVQDAAMLYVAHSLAVAPDRIKDGNKEHRALIEALRKRDGDKAAAILADHLDATFQTIAANHAEAQPAKS
ncbi:MAG: FCD domain-containing protein, partial [Streptosporangiales bacterium]|nr:FCD domain-containing protein [Streptosporangiales bacterium]